jgi:hypothetical protein
LKLEHGKKPQAEIDVDTPSDMHKRPPKTARVGFADEAEDAKISPPVLPAASPAGISRSTSMTSVHDHFPSRSKEAHSIEEPVPKSGQDTEISAVPVPDGKGGNPPDLEKQELSSQGSGILAPASSGYTHEDAEKMSVDQVSIHYTDYYREAPAKSYVQSLRPWNGRLVKDSWLRVAIRPFILFAYPAVLWSSMVYALAVGWLIVLSESVAHIYQDHDSYNFTSLQVGLVYISPFVGGVLGTAVAGKISDIVVRYMARKNDGVYEPEFRLVMAIPIAISTTIGLMGFGWSAEEKNNWAVPTIFFGVISFGCSLASTTAVTFVVDSYRVYAGESLVTLNFCKSKAYSALLSI